LEKRKKVSQRNRRKKERWKTVTLLRNGHRHIKKAIGEGKPEKVRGTKNKGRAGQTSSQPTNSSGSDKKPSSKRLKGERV